MIIKSTCGESIVIDDKFSWLSVIKWNIHSGYAVLRVNGKKYRMHRIIVGAKEGDFVDHKNRNRLDNRIENLRICSIAQNNANTAKRTKRKTTSAFKGVYLDKDRGKWRAQIKVRRKNIRLGYFDDENDAAKAYNQSALIHFGEFASINEVEK